MGRVAVARRDPGYSIRPPDGLSTTWLLVPEAGWVRRRTKRGGSGCRKGPVYGEEPMPTGENELAYSSGPVDHGLAHQHQRFSRHDRTSYSPASALRVFTASPTTNGVGLAGAPTLVCIHGLSRNARDFDAIAAALSRHYRVICPDMPGRGRSDWLANPAEYSFPLYLADCAALIARLDVENVDWIGTSMGALIGMMLAAQRSSPIRKLVLNDAGAFVSGEGLNRIGGYLGNQATFEFDRGDGSGGAQGPRALRLTDRRPMAQADDRQRSREARRRLHLQLRSSSGRPLQGGASRRRRPLVRLGRRPLPDSAPSRRAIGHRITRGRRGDGGARAESTLSSSSPESAMRRNS